MCFESCEVFVEEVMLICDFYLILLETDKFYSKYFIPSFGVR